jgi:Zn-dependent peptidase ImmA (M78 family)
MQELDYVVPPMSWADISRHAESLREQLGLTAVPFCPVIDVLERVLYQELDFVELQVRDEKEMGSAEGYTCPSGSFIRLRLDVYEAACANDGRARFTVAHELGHLFLHRNLPLARARSDDNVPPFRRSEPQANRFAADLLMPRSFMNASDSVAAVMKRHGVSMEAAVNRIDNLFKRRAK